VRNSRFSISAQISPSLSSIEAVMGISTKECTPTSSEAETVSSAAFAGRYILPDISNHERSTSETSVWSWDAESKSLSHLNWGSVKYLRQISGADEVRAEPVIDLNSGCTTLFLKDLPSNSYEESLFYDEDKMSTPARNPVTDDWIITAKKIYSDEKDVFDDIKVNLRITHSKNFFP